MRPKSHAQRVAIRKSLDEKNNRAEYQLIANAVREKRKHPSLAESLEALKQKRESESIPDSGKPLSREQKMFYLAPGTQLNFFEDQIEAMHLE